MSNAHRLAGPFLTLAACVVLAPLAFVPPAFAQGTEEQTAACSGDAFTLCRGDIPDVAKITACMRAHKPQLSARCRAVFDAGAPKAAPETKAASGPKPVPAKTASKTATAKAVSRAKPPIVTRADRAPVSKTPSKTARETDERPTRTRTVARPSERRPITATIEEVTPRPIAPAPVETVPAPERLPGFAAYRANIVSSCEKGLIDPYTCRSSLDFLKSIE